MSDPRHKLPSPLVYRMEEVFAVWNRVSAPVLWVDAEDSFVIKWLAGGKNATKADVEVELSRRAAAFSNLKRITISDASHMLHHDQPAAVAAAIEDFLA